MDLQLKNKKAVVTGGSADIGLAIARMLAEECVEVTIPGRNLKKLNESIATISGTVHAVESDLGTAEGAKKLIAQVPEVASLVTYLANPLASNTNGAALRCEGGILRTLF